MQNQLLEPFISTIVSIFEYLYPLEAEFSHLKSQKNNLFMN